MTYQQIRDARIVLDEELDLEEEARQRGPRLRLRASDEGELPDWQQFCLREGEDTDRNGGVTYQRCGGGRRIIRKRIGGE